MVLKAIRKRILVAESDKKSLNEIVTRLKKDGYDIIAASDGVEALHKAKEFRPDLVILNIFLPKTDGFKVCRLLKFDANFKSIPIIILSVRSKESDRLMAGQVKADGYLNKPFDMDKLISLIKKHLGAI